MSALAVSSLGGLALAACILLLVLLPGSLLWWALMRRAPGVADLLGPCFYLGSVLLTPVAALLVVLRATEGWTTPTVVAVLIAGSAVLTRGIPQLAGALRSAPQRLWRTGTNQPIPCLLVAGIAALEFAVCLAPNTAWDAHTLHYGIIEQFRQTGSLGVQGRGTGELFHLNSEVLNALWFGLGGEGAANLYYWLQCGSLGACVYGAVGLLAPGPWQAVAGLLVYALPVTVHQSAGGWVDTLLVQGSLLAHVLYLQPSGAAGSVAGRCVAAGLCGGYAWGVKQSAPALLLPLALIALYDLIRNPSRRAGAVWLGAAVCLVAAPWVARTWVTTGNPLFPAMPAWTRLPVSPDTSEGTAMRTPLPFGPVHMLLVHSGNPARWLDDRIPAWIAGVLALGGVATLWLGWQHWTGQGRGGTLPGSAGVLAGPHVARVPSSEPAGAPSALSRYWFATLVSFSTAYAIFFGNPRYGLYAYVLGLVPGAAAVSRAWGRGRTARAAALLLVTSAGMLGLAIAAGKAWNRRDVLLGRISPGEYLVRTYPNLRLIESIREEVRPGDAVLVFNALQYRHGMPTYDADPRASALRVSNWSTSTTDEVRRNLRELGVRWIIVPFGYGRLSTGIGLWASGVLGKKKPTKAETLELLRREFPEWQSSNAVQYWPDSTTARFSRVVQHLRELRPQLHPAASVPDWILYRFEGEGGD